jgi:hypothetical protein
VILNASDGGKPGAYPGGYSRTGSLSPIAVHGGTDINAVPFADTQIRTGHQTHHFYTHQLIPDSKNYHNLNAQFLSPCGFPVSTGYQLLSIYGDYRDVSLDAGKSVNKIDLYFIENKRKGCTMAAKVRLGINGFGRIGRLVGRLVSRHPRIVLVAINDITDAATLAHLLKFDSVHGIFKEEIRAEGENLVIAGRPARVSAVKNPAEIDWRSLNVDIVLESTGLFRSYEKASGHLTAGARKVIISAPPKGEGIKSFVIGVNQQSYDPANDHIISMPPAPPIASCQLLK